jgi:hypothetical protein
VKAKHSGREADPVTVLSHTISIKVRPTVRHVITRDESITHSDGRGSGSSGPLCEVSNEEAANEIARALELLHAPRRYVVVQRSFEPGNCVVYYAYSQYQAEQFKDVLQQFYQTDFRIYEQVLTDPRDIALHNDGAGNPMEYLMIREGQLMLTHTQEVREVGSLVTVGELTVTRVPGGRSVISMQMPDHLTPTEAAEYVTKAMQNYTDSQRPGKDVMPEHDANLDRRRAREARDLRR